MYCKLFFKIFYRHSILFDLLTILDLPKKSCGDCGLCSVRCAKAFDIKDRVQDISRLKDVPADFMA